MAKLPFPHMPSISLALAIDLEALAHNYRTLRSGLKKGAHCAAVLKANAYGMGIKETSIRLYQEGCRHFFTAHLAEAIELQCYIPKDVFIYVLNGLRKGEEKVYAHYNIIPVLGDLEQVHDWNTFAKTQKECQRAALHFDTGMIRTGLSQNEFKNLELSRFSHTEIVCILSHLACAYQSENPMNEAQHHRFDAIRKRFPFALASLAGSGGFFLSPKYHYDIVRIGLALTGCRTAIPQGNAPLKPVMKAYAQILQINDIARGDSVGYDATFIASRASQIATIGVGYADGYLRTLSDRGEIYVAGVKAPIVGRISMDLLTIDITDIPSGRVQRGDWVELFGDNLLIDDLAQKAGTIPWELLTALGARYERFYLNNQQERRIA